jgi:hypothetical protein
MRPVELGTGPLSTLVTAIWLRCECIKESITGDDSLVGMTQRRAQASGRTRFQRPEHRNSIYLYLPSQEGSGQYSSLLSCHSHAYTPKHTALPHLTAGIPPPTTHLPAKKIEPKVSSHLPKTATFAIFPEDGPFAGGVGLSVVLSSQRRLVACVYT